MFGRFLLGQFAILGDARHMRAGTLNRDRRMVWVRLEIELNFKNFGVVRLFDGDGGSFGGRCTGRQLLRLGLTEDLQLPAAVAASVQTARVGDDDALHFFDDVAGNQDMHAVWAFPQGLAREGCGVSDGFGAAHRCAQFVLQNFCE